MGSIGTLAWLGLALAVGAAPPGMIDVIADGGARGEGRTDDTAALAALLGAGKSNPHPKFGSAR